jgi:hypothetical protein
MIFDRGNGIYRSAFAALIGLALVGAGNAPEPTAKPERQKAAATKTKTPPSAMLDATEFTKPVVPTEYYQPCGQKRSKDNSDLCAQWSAAEAAGKAANWAWWQLWLSLAGVFGLGLTLWFNFHALKLAERASNGTKDALAIAERNAEAADKLSDIANESMERQLRAYVNAGNPLSSQHYDPAKSEYWWSFYELMTNFGSTPAHDVLSQLWHEIRPDELPADFSFDKNDPNTITAVIGPLGTLRTAKANISADQARQIYEGSLYFYLWGWVVYRDVFAGSNQRKTRFCYRVTVMGDPNEGIGPQHVVHWNFDYYGSHNDAT